MQSGRRNKRLGKIAKRRAGCAKLKYSEVVIHVARMGGMLNAIFQSEKLEEIANEKNWSSLT